METSVALVDAAPLGRLAIEPDDPARYTLRLGDAQLPLNPLLDRGLSLSFTGRMFCTACAEPTSRAYGGGYCYDCFTILARADLCMVSPDRCHHHLGTCREPDWGTSFCMQPHVVYLANTAGAKVGLTRADRAIGRWLDQGAVQGLVICAAATRREAGLIEATIARQVSDRADWRKLVAADAPPLDLLALAAQLREQVMLPCGAWVEEGSVETLRYPVLRYGLVEQVQLQGRSAPFTSRLLGCKGSYLLFEHGAFNVAAHAGYEVAVSEVRDPPPPEGGEQFDLF